MAEDKRIEIAWASLHPGVRIAGGAIDTPAIAKDGAVRIFKGTVNGEKSLIVFDPALRGGCGSIPWHNVGAVSYVEEPVVVFDEVEPKATPKPVAKTKSAESVA